MNGAGSEQNGVMMGEGERENDRGGMDSAVIERGVAQEDGVFRVVAAHAES